MTPAAAPLLEVVSARLGYGSREVLRDLSFSVLEGEFLGIVGPNGSGKTTLLRSLLGLVPPLSGRIAWREGGARPRVGYVPQRQVLDSVFPLRAVDVVLMGLYREIGPGRRPGASHVAAAEKALDRAAIGTLRDRPYRDLSGGQQQRVLIARALASEPALLVLDEPTNDMDLVGEHSIMEFLLELNRDEGKTVLMVSHLLNIVTNYASRIALLSGGRLAIGAVDEIVTDESLSRTYGIDVRVVRTGGRRVVFPAGGTR